MGTALNAAEQLPDEVILGPQQGPQTAFLTTKADIAIYGGAAGGGKSFALLLEPLRHHDNARFGAVIFRRNSTQVRNEGSLWHESVKLYGPLGAHPRTAVLEWVFTTGMRVKFSHLEHENSVFDWQGSQIPLIGFDELTHFTEQQFWYMLSRNRSTSGVPGYVRATTNPDVDSWVRKLIDWWIGMDGYPVQERSGILRWFIRIDDKLVWGDSSEELKLIYGEEVMPKSLTFIPSNIRDNAILMRADPTYLANLKALSRVDRLRLEGGNWNVRASAGTMFQAGWFGVLPAIPAGWRSVMRFWDRAATSPTEENPDPDWTRGVLLYSYPNGTWLVADVRSARESPGKIERLIKNTATYDGYHVAVGAQQDPGSAGKGEIEHFTRMLAGFMVRSAPSSKDKITRAKAVSAQVEAGNVYILRGPWTDDFLQELERFPTGTHDDIVDAFSGAFNDLSGSGLSLLDAL